MKKRATGWLPNDCDPSAVEIKLTEKGNMRFGRKSALEQRDELFADVTQLQQIHEQLAKIQTHSAPVVSGGITTTIKLSPDERARTLKGLSEGVVAVTGEVKRQEKRIVDGHRRKDGRPPKPENSNDAVTTLLREKRPEDFNGRFTLRRAMDTQAWLEARKVYKSADAVTKLVNRAKRSK
jgi:hypothetical protein